MVEVDLHPETLGVRSIVENESRRSYGAWHEGIHQSSGDRSGSGKTSVTLALAARSSPLTETVQTFKVGMDSH